MFSSVTYLPEEHEVQWVLLIEHVSQVGSHFTHWLFSLMKELLSLQLVQLFALPKHVLHWVEHYLHCWLLSIKKLSLQVSHWQPSDFNLPHFSMGQAEHCPLELIK